MPPSTSIHTPHFTALSFLKRSPLALSNEVTLSILADRCHPLHLPVSRRYADLSERASRNDSRALDWSVMCPASISSKKVVRSWCARRVRHALASAVRRRAAQGEHWGGGQLKILCTKRVVTANGEEVRASCERLLDKSSAPTVKPTQ
ncbi:hypothetical protein LTR28_004758 [Elasticomyces elasticus]|nr:hypothetical protein LTR28_004758 [Elasticomyces elasticus]